MATDMYNPSDEHQMIREMVSNFVEEHVEPQALEYDRDEKFNLELFRSLGELGLLGITADEQHGGAGMDATAAVIVHEELSASDPGFALAYLAHSMLFVNNLSVNGSEEQKARFLPGVCTGEKIGCMAMSEPDVGTDVLGLSSTAVRNDAGDFDERGRPQISTFLVEAGLPGYSVGQKIMDKTGMRASNTAELVFDDCLVPAANMVGEQGSALSHMMRNLELERLTLAAMAVGISRRSLQAMNRYADERQAFGKVIRDFGQIQRHIGESWAEYRAMRAYLYDTARRMTLGESGHRLDSDGIKLFSTTAAKNIADRAMQVMGGYGYVGEYVVERLWRDAKLLEIGGGTIESHQKNITKDLAKDPDAILR